VDLVPPDVRDPYPRDLGAEAPDLRGEEREARGLAPLVPSARQERPPPSDHASYENVPSAFRRRVLEWSGPASANVPGGRALAHPARSTASMAAATTAVRMGASLSPAIIAAMKRFNWALWGGLLLAVAAFLSYFAFFSQFPLTRDVPYSQYDTNPLTIQAATPPVARPIIAPWASPT